MTIVPTENDVLFGRGGAINFHPGNNRFRSMVAAQRQKFAEEKVRKKKRAIATNIMDAIHNAQPPGRFLMEALKSQSGEQGGHQGGNNGNGNRGNGNNRRGSFDREASKDGIHPVILGKVWVCVEHDKALSKVMHRLREKDNEGSGLQTPAANSVQGAENDGDGSRSSDASTSAVGSLKSAPVNEDSSQMSGGGGGSNDRPLPSGSIKPSSGTHRTSAAVLEKILPRPGNNFSSLVGVGGPNQHALPPESIGMNLGGEQSQHFESFADAAIPRNSVAQPMNNFSSQVGIERPNHHSLPSESFTEIRQGGEQSRGSEAFALTSATVTQNFAPQPMNTFSSLVVGVGGPNPLPSLPSELIQGARSASSISNSPDFSDNHYSSESEVKLPFNAADISNNNNDNPITQTQMRGTLVAPQDENEKKMMGELVETFLCDFSAHNDGGDVQGPLELSLQRWMEISKPRPDQTYQAAFYVGQMQK